ncbi:MAG: type II toxin-antitoxin system RatA family toxin [Methylococcaceae bacterium]|jgi:ribosome-associated toxin RatA of RatAB toxin-antitoxin module|nr:type II toxin-antitoxin system RatA family toxin [Methylococcales bacterium]MSR16807.1 type II toxin-antitoxin system RatA family toxin [Methylococcaceae bacterium]GDX85045.1 ubiquinone-binding protein [Methylococcaceae bacterium]
MTRIEKSALVKFSAQQMFDLVNDIESYPQFLPWCSGTRILSHSENIIEGEISISKGGFEKKFSTRNTLELGQKMVVELLDGPFAHLSGEWNFLPLREGASKISLDLDFEMSGVLANLAFGAVFNQICNTMVASFTARAKEVYVND